MSDSDNDDRGLEGWLVVQDDGGSLLLQSPTGEWRRVDTDKQEMERLIQINGRIISECEELKLAVSHCNDIIEVLHDEIERLRAEIEVDHREIEELGQIEIDVLRSALSRCLGAVKHLSDGTAHLVANICREALGDE